MLLVPRIKHHASFMVVVVMFGQPTKLSHKNNRLFELGPTDKLSWAGH